jgi:mannose-6-phosphate isomerase-like protein (cupin superfamily)
VSTKTNYEGKKEQHSAYAVSSREWIAKGTDVYVKEFTLAEHEEVPWHYHTEIYDVFYCLEGRLTIELKDIFSGEFLPTLVLGVGDSAKVDAGTAHRPFNPGPGRMRFLLVQGIGKYDYLAFDPTQEG